MNLKVSICMGTCRRDKSQQHVKATKSCVIYTDWEVKWSRDMQQQQNHNVHTQENVGTETCCNNTSLCVCWLHFWQHDLWSCFVSVTCSTEFNSLNFVQRATGTNCCRNSCCTWQKLSAHTRGCVAATDPWGTCMSPLQLFVCVHI